VNKNYRFWLALSVGGALFGAVAVAQTIAPGVMMLTPSEMKWEPQGTLALPGMEQVIWLAILPSPVLYGPFEVSRRIQARPTHASKFGRGDGPVRHLVHGLWRKI